MPEMGQVRKTRAKREWITLVAAREARDKRYHQREREDHDEEYGECAFHYYRYYVQLVIMSRLMSAKVPPTFLPGLKMLSGSKIFFVCSKSATISSPNCSPR